MCHVCALYASVFVQRFGTVSAEWKNGCFPLISGKLFRKNNISTRSLMLLQASYGSLACVKARLVVL